MYALLLLPLAAAAVDEAAANRMVFEAAPTLRQLTGAALPKLPPVVIDTRETVLAEVRATHGEEAEREATRFLEHALGVYDPDTHRITLLSDNLRQLLAQGRFPASQVEPVVRCVVAHELVHAAQDERGALAATGSPVGEALVEGQAEAISAPFCPRELRDVLAAFTPADVLGARDPADPVTLRYGMGARFVKVYEERHGAGSAWSLLGRFAPGQPPPLTEAELVAVATSGLPRWFGWSRPAEVVSSLVTTGDAAAVEAQAPWVLGLPIVETEADAGLVALRRDGVAAARSFAWRFRREAAACAWVTGRQFATRGTDSLKVFVDLPQDAVVGMPRAGAAKVEGADAASAVRWEIQKGSWYEEVWACRGAELYGVARYGVGKVELEPLLASLLTGPPVAASSGPDPEQVLARLAPPR